MLKIGIDENAYCKRYGFEKGLERMRAHGYEGLDYQEFLDTTTLIFEKNNHEFEEYLRAQRAAVESAGIVIHQVHGPWRSPQDATEADRKERFEKMSKSIAGAAILGSKHYIIHPIMPFGTKDVGHEKESYEMNLEFMNRLCNVGRENGVIVCFENMPFVNLSLASVQATLDFIKTINSDYFKMCLDTGHCTMFHTAPGDAARLIGREYVYALHIHDNDGIKDRHQMPFGGVIDWVDFGKSLHEIGFDGVISLETGVPESIPDALREYEEIGLAQKIRYIADLAEGKLPENL